MCIRNQNLPNPRGNQKFPRQSVWDCNPYSQRILDSPEKLSLISLTDFIVQITLSLGGDLPHSFSPGANLPHCFFFFLPDYLEYFVILKKRLIKYFGLL